MKAKKSITKGIWNWLIYITNNEDRPRHEQEFDVIFFMVNTVALIFGIYMFVSHESSEWIPVLIIEYTWALDNMRNNRGD